MSSLILSGQLKGLKYEIKTHEAEWSESAVKYYIYSPSGKLIKSDECEEHLALKFIEEDILKINLENQK